MATSEQPKIVLYWLEQSRSQRIIWLLEECKIPYEVKTYKRVDRRAPPELKQIHPLGKSPVISIQHPGQSEPMIIAESGLISEYLAQHFGKHLVPQQWKAGQEGQAAGETESYMRYKYYLHYAEGTLMSFMLARFLFNATTGPDVPFIVRPITKQVNKQVNAQFLEPNFTSNFEFLEGQLASSPNGGKFICGPELTAADILLSFPLLGIKASAGDILPKKYPKLNAYIEQYEQLPGYQNAIAKAEELTGEKYKLYDV